MRFSTYLSLLIVAFLPSGGCAVTVEKAKYDVVLKESSIEIRDYAPQILAETVIEGDLTAAGDKAFNLLFNYISGNNAARDSIAMTAPVSQERRSEKIAMTAPVGQQSVEEGWAVSFLMPNTYTMETIPDPLDPRVTLRSVPPTRMAAIRYSGVWSEENYRKHKDRLISWIGEKGYHIVGEPIWARYNPPFTPWFMRRNEILIPIAKEQ